MVAKVIPYDTRKRIVAAHERGKSAKEIADIFGVSRREVYRLAQQQRETGDVAIHTHDRGCKPKVTPEQVKQIGDTILEKPDITLADLIHKLELPIGVSRLRRIVRQQGFRFKKKVIHAA